MAKAPTTHTTTHTTTPTAPTTAGSDGGAGAGTRADVGILSALGVRGAGALARAPAGAGGALPRPGRYRRARVASAHVMAVRRTHGRPRGAFRAVYGLGIGGGRGSVSFFRELRP